MKANQIQQVLVILDKIISFNTKDLNETVSTLTEAIKKIKSN